uniref:Uncharacterized protein n=1 Tax=Arundo donax TaxID=35708 RepID=A0A0A9C702_ARUDO
MVQMMINLATTVNQNQMTISPIVITMPTSKMQHGSET